MAVDENNLMLCSLVSDNKKEKEEKKAWFMENVKKWYVMYHQWKNLTYSQGTHGLAILALHSTSSIVILVSMI